MAGSSVALVLGTLTKAMDVISAVSGNADLVMKAVNSVRQLASRPERLTVEEHQRVERELDALLAEFNEPLPEEGPSPPSVSKV